MRLHAIVWLISCAALFALQFNRPVLISRSSQISTASQQQNINQGIACPVCAGLKIRISLVDNVKGNCPTCKIKKFMMDKLDNKVFEQEHQTQVHPISVIEVNSEHNLPKCEKKSSSLLNKLFKKEQQPTTVTSLEVTTAKVGVTKSNSINCKTDGEDADNTTYNLRDLCVKCNLNPAQLSIANSKEMKCERLCNGCHTLMQQPTNKMTCKQSLATPDYDNNPAPLLAIDRKTVIKVQDPNNKFVIEPNANSLNLVNSDILLADNHLPIENKKPNNTDHILVDNQVHTNVINVTLPQSSQLIRQSVNQSEADNKAENEQCLTDGSPVTVLTLQNQRVAVIKATASAINPTITSMPSVTIIEERTDDIFETTPDDESVMMQEDFSDDGDDSSLMSRPAAFNPNYRSNNNTLRSNNSSTIKSNSSLKSMPSELAISLNAATHFQSKAEEIMYQNNQQLLEQHQQELRNPSLKTDDGGCNKDAMPILSYSTPPPRYEDVVKESPLFNDPPVRDEPRTAASNAALSSDPLLFTLQYLKHFGKYSELSTQPGGLNKPSAMKLSHQCYLHSHTNPQEVVVVTNPTLSNIQVFNMTGECLAIVKVNNVFCGCSLGNQLLAVATNNKLSVFNYDGEEKAYTAFTKLDGQSIKCMTSLKNSELFVILAFSGLVSLYDCRFSGIVLIKTFSTVDGHKKLFGNIVDVATTCKDDLVVLDAGSSSSSSGSSSSIYVINMATNQLKSAIYPKHELCGRLNNPSSVSVDAHNRIIVSDTGNKRLLIFYAAGTKSTNVHENGPKSNKNENNNKSIKSIQVKTLIGLRLSERDVPKFMDITKGGLLFVLVEKDGNDKLSRINVYSVQ
ncbi:hypothetical protein HELRODRAFT_190746 [Helobdella robusta]|uniref:Uncharacterized protein n=1 Tax=Helobdella robusta TaxID=6412 RepID=T1FS93_HELRO|nr:hypothetical protein HELRODRAFT_190746 [Helobdella robusta]ESO08484.1 hypothetical protein HELRODRAFT_190746 [Helobdella robusta]